MAAPEQLDHHQRTQRRLAMLAVLAHRPQRTGACLEDETLAALVEGTLDQAEVDRCLAHLAECDRCLGLWLQLDQHRQGLQRQTKLAGIHRFLARPKVLTALGSFLAAAASIAVFLTLTTRVDQGRLPHAPMHHEQMLEASPPAPSRQEEKMRMSAPAPATTGQQPHTTKEPASVAGSAALPAEKNDLSSRQQPPATAPRFKEEIAATASRLAIPTQPPRAATQAREVSLSLETWKENLRHGCGQSPEAQALARFAEQGRQLLAAGSLDTSQQEFIKAILDQLARSNDPPVRRCRRILELLAQEEVGKKR